MCELLPAGWFLTFYHFNHDNADDDDDKKQVGFKLFIALENVDIGQIGFDSRTKLDFPLIK